MRWQLALFRRDCAAFLSTQLQYPAAMFIWITGVILEPVLYMVVWRVAAATQKGAVVGGLTQNYIAAYYAVFLVVNFLSFTWFFIRMEDRVRMGSFSVLLMRPVHPLYRDVAENLTYKLVTSAATVPTVILLVVGFSIQLGLTWVNLLLFLPSLLLATAMRFMFEWTLALSAFWIVRTDAVSRIYGFVMHFLGGFAAPLALLPAGVATVAYWLPFPWMVAFPVTVALGGHDVPSVLLGLLVQAFWLAVAAVLLKVVWRAGTRRFAAVNG
ncbi:MAG: ABC-2 family transporter protein [Actinobacteria bacterium]|nr:ABC-2 family transporter protein [Actinomycetota bacterium]